MIDPAAIRALGYPGTVVAPGEWAYPMNGWAWLTVEGQKVDVLYRDLDDVEKWIDEAEQGRWELYRVPGYLCGMPSYVLVGELALCRVLLGTLPRPSFPERLRLSAPRRWGGRPTSPFRMPKVTHDNRTSRHALGRCRSRSWPKHMRVYAKAANGSLTRSASRSELAWLVRRNSSLTYLGDRI
jgi:hypothetical protein